MRAQAIQRSSAFHQHLSNAHMHAGGMIAYTRLKEHRAAKEVGASLDAAGVCLFIAHSSVL